MVIEYEGDDSVDNHTAEEAQCHNESVLPLTTPVQNIIGAEGIPNAPRKGQWSYYYLTEEGSKAKKDINGIVTLVSFRNFNEYFLSSFLNGHLVHWKSRK